MDLCEIERSLLPHPLCVFAETPSRVRLRRFHLEEQITLSTRQQATGTVHVYCHLFNVVLRLDRCVVRHSTRDTERVTMSGGEESVSQFFVRMRQQDPTIIQCNDCTAKNPTWASGVMRPSHTPHSCHAGVTHFRMLCSEQRRVLLHRLQRPPPKHRRPP